jgi:enoyl-CoA hydratase
MKTSVRIEQLEQVTVVTLERPEVRNAVDADSARGAAFHGANGHFCAGWDLQAARAGTGSSELQSFMIGRGLPFSSIAT